MATGTWICPHCHRELATHALSGREIQVVTLLASGLTNREIAEILTVSRSTLKNHISAIRCKLGTRTRVATAITAIQRGIVPSPAKDRTLGR